MSRIKTLLAAVPESLWGLRTTGLFPDEAHEAAAKMWIRMAQRELGGLRPFGREVAEHTGLGEDNFVKRLRDLDAPTAGVDMTALAAVAALRASEGLPPLTPAIPEGPRHALGRASWAVLALHSGNAQKAAEDAGLNTSTLRQAFRRRASPRAKSLQALAAGTPGLSAGWLLRGEGNGPPLVASEIGLRMRSSSDEATPPAPDVEPKPPRRTLVIVDRVVRNTALPRQVKHERGHQCEVCGADPLELPGGRLYAEAHHVKPLGREHTGQDEEDNMLCVCPTCHVLLDYFAVPLDPERVPSVLPEYVAYHNERHEEVKRNGYSTGSPR